MGKEGGMNNKNIAEAIYDLRNGKTKVVAEDQSGKWRQVNQWQSPHGTILYLRDLSGYWFIPQQWKEVGYDTHS